MHHKILDLKIPEQLSLDAGWSIGEKAFGRITTTLLEMSSVKKILEFGSGPSSIRLVMAFSEGQVYEIV